MNKRNIPHFCFFFQGDYSLLFHAVVRANEEGFKILLEAGADPDWRNRAGNTVLNLIAKRQLVDWADHCIKIHQGMDEERIVKFANQGSFIGGSISHTCV